jgi:hypothetical protein
MTTKIKGTEGIQFPDASVQHSAAAVHVKGSSGEFTLNMNVPVVGTGWATSKAINAPNINPTSGRWTAPVKGLYQVNFSSQYDRDGINSAAYATQLGLNGATVAYSSAGSTGTVFPQVTGSAVVEMNGTTDFISVSANSSFSGATRVSNSYSATLIARLP